MSTQESYCYPQQANTLKVNKYVLIKDRPCKIISYHSVKDGKHGHAKVTVVGVDIFSGKKVEFCTPASSNVSVPEIKRIEYEYIDKQDDYLILMDQETYETREDIKIDDENIMKQIEEYVTKGSKVIVAVQQFGSLAKVVEAKESKF